MKKDYALKEYYSNYLMGVRKLSQSTAKHYVGGLSTITKLLKSKGKIQDSIYEINNFNEVFVIKAFFKNDI